MLFRVFKTKPFLCQFPDWHHPVLHDNTCNNPLNFTAQFLLWYATECLIANHIKSVKMTTICKIISRIGGKNYMHWSISMSITAKAEMLTVIDTGCRIQSAGIHWNAAAHKHKHWHYICKKRQAFLSHWNDTRKVQADTFKRPLILICWRSVSERSVMFWYVLLLKLDWLIDWLLLITKNTQMTAKQELCQGFGGEELKRLYSILKHHSNNPY